MTALPVVRDESSSDFAGAGRAALRQEIGAGLSRPQKELPTRLFYDRRGSELFEEITRLPEYYLTRTEEKLLSSWIPRWITELRPRTLVELGAGSAAKTRIILDAMRDAGSGERYVPVDISTDFLNESAAAIRSDYAGLHVQPLAADLTGELRLPTTLRRPLLIAFLGSTIGNFPPQSAVALLGWVRGVMESTDRLLLGVDLRHDIATLEAAYNDARGVTAEFNFNLLHVVNREFGADFDVTAFRHVARYDVRHHRIEMHLLSTRDQIVDVPGTAAVSLLAGETIRTEISCKHDRLSIASMFAAAGLNVAAWAPDQAGRYALVLGAGEEMAAKADQGSE